MRVLLVLLNVLGLVIFRVDYGRGEELIEVALTAVFIASGLGLIRKIRKRYDWSTYRYFAQKSEENFITRNSKRRGGDSSVYTRL